MQTKNQCNKLTTLRFSEIKSASPAVKKKKEKHVYNQFAFFETVQNTALATYICPKRKKKTEGKKKKKHSLASPLMCKH